MFIDTHCHLDDEKFTDIIKTVKTFEVANVGIAINMGCNLQSSIKSKELAENFQSIYFAVGFHPSDAHDFDLEVMKEIKKLSLHEKCVAIGEIGLDYHWEPFDKEKQKTVFNLQLDLANDECLPVSVHSRDATKDVLDILKSNMPKSGGVMHCFSGSKETAKELLDLGFYLGFGGTVTFKNASNLKEVAKYVPMDRILTETDCPYLSPEPFRGQRNEPKNIPIIAKYLAELKGVFLEVMENTLYSNAKNLFKKLK